MWILGLKGLKTVKFTEIKGGKGNYSAIIIITMATLIGTIALTLC